MASIKLAVIVGSNRKDSINRKLANALVKLAGDRVEASLVQIDDLPMYNMDLEGNRPDAVNRFTAEVAACDAVLLVTPEHNRSIPAVLKNAIDWGSKPMDKNVWRGKATAITGTSPGAIGTAVGQQHLRQIMGILGGLVMGGEAYIAFKPDLIAEDGSIAIEDTRAFLQTYIDNFVNVAQKLSA
ncbi:NADPH-dependent FMN reductase [Thalassospira sp. MCCC 1A01428]|uniref:NADPH-dependent FMN reductase n=1 Tax=Thalassospira sp. MCCC 1A01428 TaxID=1470575 RepID=UPI000A1F40AC|nr:NAD(P)H-dependent oxidoreductase [Thalassospira sp. MCCC 1A01428]OSQ43271.1 ACP phosphodiesterase [Thalassospira sp. MCCC 1A01428]